MVAIHHRLQWQHHLAVMQAVKFGKRAWQTSRTAFWVVHGSIDGNFKVRDADQPCDMPIFILTGKKTKFCPISIIRGSVFDAGLVPRAHKTLMVWEPNDHRKRWNIYGACERETFGNRKSSPNPRLFVGKSTTHACSTTHMQHQFERYILPKIHRWPSYHIVWYHQCHSEWNIKEPILVRQCSNATFGFR